MPSVLLACTAACGALQAQSWSNYNSYTSSYTLPYAVDPNTGTQTSPASGSLYVNVVVNGTSMAVQLDTGSRGFWISSVAAGYSSTQTIPGIPGYIFYWSSGIAHIGVWQEMTVSFPGAVAANGSVTTVSATVPVLVVSGVTCEQAPAGMSWPNPCNFPGGTMPITTATGFMGIGFDRTGYGTGYGTSNVDPTGTGTTANLQILNPFLNLTEMVSGAMRAGYILSQTGITLGLTAANTAKGYQGSSSAFAYAQLVPTGTPAVPGTPTDWQVMTGSTTVGGTTYPAAQAVIDIGIKNALLTAGVPASALPGVINVNGLLYLSAGSGTMTVDLLGVPGMVGYAFTPTYSPSPAASNTTVVPQNVALSPSQTVEWTGTSATLVNTGIYALNAFNYLYDATGGYIGLQLNGTAADASAFFSPVISAIGTLSLSNAFSTDLPVYLRGDSTVSTTTTALFAGDMWGPGGLTIAGTGVVTLAGANTYEGGTVVQQGTLNLTGALAGAVTVQPGATFTNSGNYVGALTDAGSVVNSGNMVAGITVQSSGTLANSGTIIGQVLNAGVFTSSGSVVGTVGNTGVFSNSGVVGGSVVNSGAFSNNGSVTQTVLTSGTLSGNGSVGTLVVVGGGAVAPGNSIGTMRVTGDATFQAGTALVAELGAPGVSDQLVVGGTLTAQGAYLVPLVGAGFTPQLGATYSVVSAGQTASTFTVVSPDFGTVSATYPFLAGSLNTAGTLTLERSTVPYAALAPSANAAAAAGAANTVALSQPLAQSLAILTNAQAPAALSTLTGEIYASAQSTLQIQSAYVRSAVTGRLEQAQGAAGAARTVGLDPAGTTLWGQAYGGWGSSSSDGNASATSRSLAGFLIGLDGLAGDWRVGVAAGFSQSSFSTDSLPGSGTSDNYDLVAYAGRSFGPGDAFVVRAGAAYTWHDLSVSRTVSVPGQIGALGAGYDAGTAQVFGELGYDFSLTAAGRPLTLEPFAGLAYTALSTGGFAEPYGAAALRAQSAQFDTTTSTLGLKARTTALLGATPVSVSGTIGWQHAFGDLTPTTSFVFNAGSLPFTVGGAPLAADALVLSAGVSTALSEHLDLSLIYAGQFAGNVTENALKGSLAWRF